MIAFSFKYYMTDVPILNILIYPYFSGGFKIFDYIFISLKLVVPVIDSYFSPSEDINLFFNAESPISVGGDLNVVVGDLSHPLLAIH